MATEGLAARWRARWWRLLWRTQGWDYGRLLPALARLPLGLALPLAGLRDRVNGRLHRDWRSMSLGFAHVATQTGQAHRALFPQAAPATLARWLRGRFQTESRNEFEAELVNQGRVQQLHFALPQQGELAATLRDRGEGLLLLIPHWDGFHIGTAFLGQWLAGSGRAIYAMSSAVFEDPRVHGAVQQHLNQRYRGIEQYFNGGKVMHLEDGLRQFYQVLDRGDILVVLADSPPTAQGVAIEVPFLTAGRRRLAGGAVKMARRHNSRIASCVCQNIGPGHYELRFSPIAPIDAPGAVDQVYEFLSAQIRHNPERWLAADLLSHMPEVAPRAHE